MRAWSCGRRSFWIVRPAFGTMLSIKLTTLSPQAQDTFGGGTGVAGSGREPHEDLGGRAQARDGDAAVQQALDEVVGGRVGVRACQDGPHALQAPGAPR